MSLKVDILKAFIEKRPDVVAGMRSCDHGEEGSLNPYHLEGDVWTHTMLTYNQANDDFTELIMALCHDIGKIYTRRFNENGNGKVSFYGHSDASVQPTIDFLCYLLNIGMLSKYSVNYFIEHCLNPIGNHIIYYQNYDKLAHFSNDNAINRYYLNKMAKMDGEGSICKAEKIEQADEIPQKHFEPINFDPYKKTIIIYSGVPGSGKDYLAEMSGAKIISFDNIRLDVYGKYNTDDMTEIVRYDKSFKYCNDNNIDLMKLLIREVNDAFETTNIVAICNTSLTRKSRRAIINSFGSKYNFIVRQVFAPSDVIIQRNSSRDYRFVSMDVIIRMMRNINVVSHFEPGICKIEYILNV